MPGYRGARGLMEGGAEVAGRQKSADSIANKAQRVRRAAETARKAKERADAHESELSTGVLRALDLGEMALLNRLNGELPNRNISTIQDATKIGDGVVAARAMIAQDAAAFNLWAQNAMIRNAKIADLAVDKLSAGTFTAGDIILAAGGAVRAGQTRLDSGGLTMSPVANWSAASADRAYKITSMGDTSAIGFLNDGTDGVRGIGMRAEGAGLNRSGSVIIEATRFVGDTAQAASSAFLHISAERALDGNVYRPQVYASPNLHCDAFYSVGRAQIDGVLNPNGGIDPHRYCEQYVISANGGWRQWNHGSGNPQVHCQFQAHMGDGNWRPIEFLTDLFVDFIDSTVVRVKNNRSDDLIVRGWVHNIVNL